MTTEAATNVGLSTATLHGSVNPGGLATAYRFEYGTSTAYTKSVPVPDATVGSDSAVHQLSSAIAGLTPGERYHFRIVATSAGGVSDGPDMTFTTLPRVVISGVSQSHRRWREGNRLASISRKQAPVGTTFRFSLNTPAPVSFAFTQPGKGRAVRGKCVAESKRNRRKPKCAVLRQTLSFSAHARVNSVRFAGRSSRSKKLKPGEYTLVISATTPGFGSTSARLTFKIVT